MGGLVDTGVAVCVAGCMGVDAPFVLESYEGLMGPHRPDMEPFGVLRLFRLLGNRPNCGLLVVGEMGERGEAIPGDCTDAPETEAYAESFP